MEMVRDRLILSLLRTETGNDEDFEEISNFRSAEELLFIRDLSKLNLGMSVMSVVWRKLLRSQHPTRMSFIDWSVYAPIMHTLPLDVVSRINVSDPDVLRYFGTLKALTPRQLATIGDRLRMEFGEILVTDREMIARLGNLLCGFNAALLEKLSLNTYRVLFNGSVFKDFGSCNSEQLKTLLRVGLEHRMFGPPGTWNTSTVTSLGYLIAGLDASQMRKIRDVSVKRITPDVIRSVPVDVLQNMRLEQVKALDARSVLAWRRRTRDVTHFSSAAISSAISAAAVFLTSSVIYA